MSKPEKYSSWWNKEIMLYQGDELIDQGTIKEIAERRDDYHDMDAKRRLRRMQCMGLVRLARGLFDEDGFTAGSGWTREHSKNSIIERIIENYTAKNKQLSLADL